LILVPTPGRAEDCLGCVWSDMIVFRFDGEWAKSERCLFYSGQGGALSTVRSMMRGKVTSLGERLLQDRSPPVESSSESSESGCVGRAMRTRGFSSRNYPIQLKSSRRGQKDRWEAIA